MNGSSAYPRLLASLRPARRDPIREAVERLEALLPEREDSRVLVDFLEDDLREGLSALSDVEAHFTDILDLLRAGPITPVQLLEAGEDLHVLKRLEYLLTVVTQTRRRLCQAAGRIDAED